MKVLFWRKSKLVFKRAKKVGVVGKSATLINLGDGLPVFNQFFCQKQAFFDYITVGRYSDFFLKKVGDVILACKKFFR